MIFFPRRRRLPVRYIISAIPGFILNPFKGFTPGKRFSSKSLTIPNPLMTVSNFFLMSPVESIEKTIGESIVRKSIPRSYPKPEIKKKIDARAYPRKAYRKSLLFNYKNTICRGLVTNISRGGAYIKTDSRVSFGQKIKFVITVSRTSKNIKLMGWIVRLTAEGFAVSFERRSGSERRYDLDRRIGLDRRKRSKPVKPP
jgi:hypothetical protein